MKRSYCSINKKNTTNSSFKIVEIVGISLLTSFMVVGVSWWIRLPLSRGIDGLATLGTLLGGIAVFGGVITSLISLVILSSIEDRIAAATNNENERRDKELDTRWSHYAAGLERYWAALNSQDIDLAGELMEQAFQWSGKNLSVASYTMFKRYWDATEAWAWDQIDSFHPPRRREILENYVNPTPFNNQNYSVEGIKWGLRALESTEVPDRATVLLKLAQLYALEGDYQSTLNYLTESLRSNPDQQFYHTENWLLLLWNWNDEEKILAILTKIRKETKKVTNDLVQEWVNDKKNDLYRGTMAPVVALGKNGSASITQLTIYSVGSYSLNSHGFAWVIQHNQTRYPLENQPPWSLNDVVRFINQSFNTIGRIQ